MKTINAICVNEHTKINQITQAIKRKTMHILLKSVKIQAMDPADLDRTDAG